MGILVEFEARLNETAKPGPKFSFMHIAVTTWGMWIAWFFAEAWPPPFGCPQMPDHCRAFVVYV